MESQIKQFQTPNSPLNSETLTPNSPSPNPIFSDFDTYSSPDTNNSLEYDKTTSYSLNTTPFSSVYSWSTGWDMEPKTTSSTTWAEWPKTSEFDSTGGDKCGFIDRVNTNNMSLDEVDNVILGEDKLAIVGAGLANLGNTCFLNAVLQCCVHTVPLLQGLLAFDHKVLCDTASLCVICALRELIELSLTSIGRSVSPWKFVDSLSYISSSFQRFQQEDAHEFLQCFLDRLETCCNNLNPLRSLTPDGHNFVKQVFGGRLVSKLKCCNCGHCSDTYEPSIDLSLEIDDADNLLNALESFMKVEKIEDTDTQYTCEECKKKVSIEKQLLLDQAPSIFAFHLKRFKNYGSFVEKIDKFVGFPLELDMLPFTGPSKVNVEELMYDLYAVVVHIGFSSTSGHYYCFVRLSPGAWYKFDDSEVVQVREEYVLSQEAYILFYAKKGTPWFSDYIDTQKQVLEQSLLNTSPKSVLDCVDIYSSCSTSTVLNSHGCDGKEFGPTEDSLAHNFKESAENKIDGHGTEDDLIKTDLHPTASSTPLTYYADHVASPSVLKESNRNQPSDVNSGVANNTSKFAKITPKTQPRSVSPEIYRKDSPDIVYSIPRGHLKSAETVTCKRQLNAELEDMGIKQACSLIKKNIRGSRAQQQLMAAVRGSYSEGSVNKKRSRGDAATHSDRNSTGRDRSYRGTGARILAAATNFR